MCAPEDNIEERRWEMTRQLPISKEWEMSKEGAMEEGNGATVRLDEQSSGEPRIRYANREQMLLKGVNVDRLVGEDHEIRAIWELLGKVDLRVYYKEIKALEGVAGSSAIDPRVLISVWIYSYSKGISSAREISRLCEYDPSYQWVTGMEPINYHTLSDFRSKHKEELEELFIEVLGVLSEEGLVSIERVMQDGTKVKAYCSGDTFRREDTVRAHLEMATERVRLMEEKSDEDDSRSEADSITK